MTLLFLLGAVNRTASSYLPWGSDPAGSQLCPLQSSSQSVRCRRAMFPSVIEGQAITGPRAAGPSGTAEKSAAPVMEKLWNTSSLFHPRLNSRNRGQQLSLHFSALESSFGRRLCQQKGLAPRRWHQLAASGAKGLKCNNYNVFAAPSGRRRCILLTARCGHGDIFKQNCSLVYLESSLFCIWP